LKPYGLKPYGLKPYGLKPYGLKGGLGEEDEDAWSAGVSTLVTERSAVIRLGATVVCADDEVRVPSLARLDANGLLNPFVLGSRANNPLVTVRLENRLGREYAENREVAEPLMLDFAEGFAEQLDGVVLGSIPPTQALPQDNLRRLRGLVSAVRRFPLRNPGWVIDRASLDDLTTLRTANATSVATATTARTLDSYGLLRRDGADGGVLLGFPFVTSDTLGVFFSADWDEAWIGVYQHLVNVAFSQDSAFAAGETELRATMSFESILRRPEAFAGTRLVAARPRRAPARARARKS
jgi:hypothetical protein